MTAIGSNGDLPADLWNSPLPSFSQIYQDLIRVIDKELADVPIQQQTAIVAALWDVDSWGVDILSAPPPRGSYNGWAGRRGVVARLCGLPGRDQAGKAGLD